MISLRKNLNSCNLYIFLWAFGYVQNVYLNSSALSMLSYIPFTLMTLYYIAQMLLKYRMRGGIKVLLFFFLILCVYGLILLLFNNAFGQDPKSFLMMLFSSLGPVFPFYVFSRRGQITEKKMKICFGIFFVIAIMNYYEYEQKALLLLALNGPYEEITNNTTYYLVGLLPFVFLFGKRPLVQYLLIVCILGLVLSGMKRGAILTSVLLLIWFIFRTMKNISIKRKVVIMCVLALFVFVGIGFVENLYNSSDYFQQRIGDTVEGKSSGRDVLYLTYWNHYINNDNLFQLIFGEGAYHTENILHLKAHNDWLELLIDCGVFGVILYIIYWCSFLRDWKLCESNSIMYSMLGACFIFTFLRTFFSMSFSDMPFSICMMMGYCWGQIHIWQNKNEVYR